MKKNIIFDQIPCEKCLQNLVESESKYKLKPDDKMLNKEFCPSCLSAANAFFGIVGWLYENVNEHRISQFKVRDDGRFAEFKIGGCYIKVDSRMFAATKH